MPLVTRFNLDDILGNEVVDFQVLEANNEIIGNNAAHLTLSNSYSAMQEVHRAAANNPALQVRLDADAPASPRLTITADGTINWAGGGSVASSAGVLTIGGTMLVTPTLRTAAGTAAAPSQSFTTDTDTGFYSPSADVLGFAVGGVEVNRINNQGEIRFNRTNARISAYTSDDPTTPGERLVYANALTVTPGMLFAAKLTVNGNSQVNGNETVTGNLTANGAGSIFTSNLQVNGAIRAYGGLINFEGSNVVNIQWRGDLGALYIPYGNGIYTTSGRFVGNVSIDGTSYHGRIVSGGWDVGWTNNFGGSAIAQGRFYQRANGGFYCYDAGDFAYSVGVNGSQLVQRSPEGYIYANYLNMTANVSGGKPQYVVGMSGDNFLRYWPANSIGPPSGVGVASFGVGFNNQPGDGQWQRGATITLDRTGQWVIFAIGRVEGTVGAGSIQYRLLFNGSVAGQYQDDALGTGGNRWYGSMGIMGQTIFGAGSWVAIDVWNEFGGNRMSGTLFAYFLSTQDYPN